MINNINRDKSLVQKKSSKLCRHYTLKEVECKLSFLKWKVYALTLLRRIQFGRRKKSKFTVKKPDSQPGNQCQSEQWLLVLIYMYPWHGMMNKAFHLYSLPLQNHKPLQTWESIRLLPINECFIKYLISSVVDQSYSTLRDPMNCSTPSLPVYHQVPELPQTHVHRVSDAIQPSHPLSSTSPPALSPSQDQGLSNESTLQMRWPKYYFQL